MKNTFKFVFVVGLSVMTRITYAWNPQVGDEVVYLNTVTMGEAPEQVTTTTRIKAITAEGLQTEFTMKEGDQSGSEDQAISTDFFKKLISNIEKCKSITTAKTVQVRAGQFAECIVPEGTDQQYFADVPFGIVKVVTFDQDTPPQKVMLTKELQSFKIAGVETKVQPTPSVPSTGQK